MKKLELYAVCPQCGKDLVIKKSRTGSRFIACMGYPDCHYAASISTGVTCPACGEGQLVEKSTRKGKIFYSCDKYPKCDFALWQKPVPKPCPRCGSAWLVEKKGRNGTILACPTTGCDYTEEPKDDE